MSSESIKEKAAKALDELMIAVATETRHEVIADFNERLQKTFGGGFKIAIDTETTGVNGYGSVTHVTEQVPARHVTLVATKSKKGTAGQDKPKKKRRMTAKFRAAMEKNLAKARAQRAKNLRAEKRGAKRKTKKK